jgi:ABC-type sugar transport system substrate-binding protein
MRKNGFLDGIKNMGINIPGTITIQSEYSYVSSLIAREINTKYRDKFNCIYCVDGIMEKVCLAIKKLKLNDSVLCIGHEKPRSIDRYIAEGFPIACIEQDVFSQGVKAAGLAVDYIKNKIVPPKTDYYIDSKCYIYNT